MDGGLLACKKDLVQPLARPHAGKHHLNVNARLKPRQADHSLGEFYYPDRLSHVEDVNGDIESSRRQSMRRRRKHKVAGFAHCHEVPDHVWMRDCDGAARIDLRLEFWHYRAVRRQHVAELGLRSAVAAACHPTASSDHGRGPGSTFRQIVW